MSGAPPQPGPSHRGGRRRLWLILGLLMGLPLLLFIALHVLALFYVSGQGGPTQTFEYTDEPPAAPAASSPAAD